MICPDARGFRWGVGLFPWEWNCKSVASTVDGGGGGGGGGGFNFCSDGG